MAAKALLRSWTNTYNRLPWCKGIEIRKRKTDKIDSFLIADLLRYGDFLEISLSDENIMSLRNLSRFRYYPSGSIGDLKRKAICVLD